MADDETTEPEGDPAAEQGTPPAAEETPTADEASAAEETPAAEEPSATEPPADPPGAGGDEEPLAEEAGPGPADQDSPDAPEPDSTAGQADSPAAEAPKPPATEKPKGADLPPGAELEPIAIEPERELTAEQRAAAEAEAEERAAAEAGAADDEDEQIPTRATVVELEPSARVQATGKRKSAVARVVLKAGSGTISVNDRTLEVYFPRDRDQTVARQPLVAAGCESAVDVAVRVHGGGSSGQAGAVRHGIARALVEVDSELRGELKRRGMLTRDARAKERRKAGLKKARKRPQFSKR